MKFNEIIDNKDILKIIEEHGFLNPTEIQKGIIPFILEGKDVLGQSQTGTGKTLAFIAPILSKLDVNKEVQALILAPTRELAIQISREASDLSKYMNVSIACVYGSSSISDQISSLKKGVNIVVGTPGRVKDLINRGVLKLEAIKFFVLDEADEMLSMGFQDELEYIFEHTKKSKQVLLFSATMPKQILSIAKKYMHSDYKTISIEHAYETADNIEQYYYLVSDKTRIEAMCRVMDYYNPNRAIIFCRTKRNADDVFEKLSSKGYKTDIIHGDITQGQRIATLDRFKSGAFNYLIATDVAARGIHVDDIQIVLNYNLPETSEAYVHRIGRTGRATKSGIAVTFVKDSEESKIRGIEKHVKASITKKDLPTVDSILENRMSLVEKLVNNYKDNSYEQTEFSKYLENFSNDELKNIIAKLLEEKLLSDLGSDFNTDISIKNKKKSNKNKRQTDDTVRVFMTIGKMDNIEKRDFLCFIEKTAGVPEGTCSGVEIMTKFTFLNIKKNMYDKVFKKCNNITYNGRVIRIEKAKK